MVSLHHVNLVVAPGTVEAVADFYVDLLGLRRLPRPPSTRPGIWLELGDGRQVHLAERDGEAHPDSHFALVVEAFDELLDALAKVGAPWTWQTPMKGVRRGFTRDPAGNRIELISSRPDCRS